MTSKWIVEKTPCEDGSGLHEITATNGDDPSVKHMSKVRFVEGVANLSKLTEERFHRIDQNLVYKDTDIIITSYPKCGTTWTEQCVLLLLNQGNKDLLDPSHKNVYQPGSNVRGKLWPEASIENDTDNAAQSGLEFASITFDDFNNAPGPRVIKSHARSEHLLGCNRQGLTGLKPDGVEVLIVSRNPLDACVSSFYHAFNPFKNGWSFDAWAAVWLTGNVTFGCYFEWVRGWYEDVQHNPTKAMWLQYEDMQSDPRGQIEKIAAYLEIPVTEEIVDNVLRYSSFDSMKEQANAKGGDHGGHLRQGKSGDWKNHFSEQLVQEFREKYNKEMAGTGLSFSIGEGEPFTAST